MGTQRDAPGGAVVTAEDAGRSVGGGRVGSGAPVRNSRQSLALNSSMGVIFDVV